MSATFRSTQPVDFLRQSPSPLPLPLPDDSPLRRWPIAGPLVAAASSSEARRFSLLNSTHSPEPWAISKRSPSPGTGWEGQHQKSGEGPRIAAMFLNGERLWVGCMMFGLRG